MTGRSDAEEIMSGRWKGEERKAQHPADDQFNNTVQPSLTMGVK